MGKCLAGCDRPYVEIDVCDSCFHKDVCDDKDYLTENECSSYCDNKELKAAREKQIAKKPSKVTFPDENDNRFVYCPVCGAGNELATCFSETYCWKCGQRLKWKE